MFTSNRRALAPKCLQQSLLMIHSEYLTMAEFAHDAILISVLMIAKRLVNLLISLERREVGIEKATFFDELWVVISEYLWSIVVSCLTLTFSLFVRFLRCDIIVSYFITCRF